MTDLPELTPEEQRVLGSLLEKQTTVPASYPLSGNALRTACNQTSSREPVTDYDERTVEQTARALKERGLVRIVWAETGRRTLKYHQVLDGMRSPAEDSRHSPPMNSPVGTLSTSACSSMIASLVSADRVPTLGERVGAQPLGRLGAPPGRRRSAASASGEIEAQGDVVADVRQGDHQPQPAGGGRLVEQHRVAQQPHRRQREGEPSQR